MTSQQLLNSIKTKLKISNDIMIDAEIEGYIEGIDPELYLDFFKAISLEKSFYPMEKIANVAKRFKEDKKGELFSGVRHQAKQMYDSFYALNVEMTDYAMQNREAYPTDREFFLVCKYDDLKTTQGDKRFNEQELYVLKQLGGGEWLASITSYLGSSVIIEKIETIIKNSITKKYLAGNTATIENKKVLGDIKCLIEKKQ